jgi:predicted dehydrogenase
MRTNGSESRENQGEQTVAVGVIGTGNMGRHHVRVYDSLPGTDLVGVADANKARVANIADEHDTSVRSIESLLDVADTVSIAVPTQYHHEIAKQCLTAGVDVLVEKPFVEDSKKGQELIRVADQHDALIQVGHVERFNPVVEALDDILENQEIVALHAERLGPPLEQNIDDGVVLDLMIHDIDIVLSLLDENPVSIDGVSVHEEQHAMAMLEFESEVVASLKASRLTQKKVRKLDVVCKDCLVRVDYIERSVEIHRASTPEFIQENEDIRYRHESIVERPRIESTEPLKNELSSFVEAVRTRSIPEITGWDGIQALNVASKINEECSTESQGKVGPEPAEVELD